MVFAVVVGHLWFSVASMFVRHNRLRLAVLVAVFGSWFEGNERESGRFQ